MHKFIHLLALIMTTSCSTYSVTCLHNEATSSDLSPDEETHVHNKGCNCKSQVVIKTNKAKHNDFY